MIQSKNLAAQSLARCLNRASAAVAFGVTMLSLYAAPAAVHAEILSEGTDELVGFSCAQWRDWNTTKPSRMHQVSKCWDFEEGQLGDSYWGFWTVRRPATWTAFNNQPTYGDNVRVSRVHQSGATRQQLNAIGGDYWNVPAPIGHQGKYWLGTYEHRPRPGDAWGGTQGDHPIGKIHSPSFTIDRDYITFLIGGDCNNGFIGLQVYDPRRRTWTWAVSSRGGEYKMRARTCSELMERRVFNTGFGSGLQGKTARLEIRDNWRGGWGHLNVDHIVHTDLYPTKVGNQDQPVWGWADTHAHVGTHLAFQSSMASPTDGYMFHGDPEATTWCDGHGHKTDHQGGPVLISTLEGASFGEGINAHENKPRFPDDWPYWFTRGHQQMRLPWMRRAYEGGQRLMVAASTNAEIIGAFMRENHQQGYVSDFGAMRRFAIYMKDLASRHDWMEIALTPTQAIDIIRANKLAIVLATEVDNIGDQCGGNLLSTAEMTPFDLNYTNEGSAGNPWSERKDLPSANPCDSAAEWRQRVEDLYELGYRVITPIHLTDNDLGGAAVYSDLFNVMQRFNNGSYFSVETTPSYSFNLSNDSFEMGWCSGSQCLNAFGFDGVVIGLLAPILVDVYTPVRLNRGLGYPRISSTVNGEPLVWGHQNTRSLSANGEEVLDAMMERGMVIDVSHMGRKTRDRVLGVGADAYDSIVNPDCNMGTYGCQKSAYPVIASHSSFQEMAWDGRGDENGLTDAHIRRILRGGGTIAVGTADADVRATNDAMGTASSLPLVQQYVENDCGGSSRSFAQSYTYALRQLDDYAWSGGVTLGTDFNGLQSQLNPRFGTLGCYARGNIPQVFAYGHTGEPLVADPEFQKDTPLRYAPEKLQCESPDPMGTAGGQRIAQIGSSDGLRYSHYMTIQTVGSDEPLTTTVVPPNGSSGNLHFATRGDPSDYAYDVCNGSGHNLTPPYRSESMRTVATLPALTPSQFGSRTFDLNYDGLSHYGMLPDMLQDARTVGMTQEQLGPLFRGANDFIKTWMKACSLAVPGATSSPGCN